MTGFMQPPVADEPAPRSKAALVVAGVVFIALVIALIQLARPAPFDEESAPPVLPATEDTLTLGISAIKKEDGVSAYALLLPHADSGNPMAQAAIGMIYASGFFGTQLQDYCKGALWIDRSARGGFPYSMALLSAFYKEGSGVKRNPVKAYFWLRQAELGIGASLDQVLKNRIAEYGKWQRDEKYGLARFLPPLEELEQRLQTWKYAEEAPITIAPLPNIPVVDFFAEIFWVKGQGCHNLVRNWPLELSFFDKPPRRIRR